MIKMIDLADYDYGQIAKVLKKWDKNRQIVLSSTTATWSGRPLKLDSGVLMISSPKFCAFCGVDFPKDCNRYIYSNTCYMSRITKLDEYECKPFEKIEMAMRSCDLDALKIAVCEMTEWLHMHLDLSEAEKAEKEKEEKEKKNVKKYVEVTWKNGTGNEKFLVLKNQEVIDVSSNEKQRKNIEEKFGLIIIKKRLNNLNTQHRVRHESHI